MKAGLNKSMHQKRAHEYEDHQKLAWTHSKAIVTAVCVACVRAWVVDTLVLRILYLLARVVQVSRTAKSPRAHNAAIDARCFDAKGRIINVATVFRQQIISIPGFGAIAVYWTVTLVALESFKFSDNFQRTRIWIGNMAKEPLPFV